MDEIFPFDCTLEDFRNMNYKHPGSKTFDSVIIVPMPDIHDSGYACMKFILCNLKGQHELVGVVGGACDVVELDGIGGYGLNGPSALNDLLHDLTLRVDWSIDCFPKSMCLRLFGPKMILKDKIICSTFEVFSIKED